MAKKIVDIGIRSSQEENILHSAAKVFARKGYDRSTMDEIAREAKLSKPTLYVRFKSKELLIIQLIEKIFRDIDSFVLEAATQMQNPVDRVAHFIQLDLNYFTSNPEHFILILTERKLLRTDDFETYHRIALDKYLHHIHIMAKYLIMPGIKGRIFRNLGAQKMAFFLSGLVISAVWRSLLGEFIGLTPESLQGETKAILNIFFDGVRK